SMLVPYGTLLLRGALARDLADAEGGQLRFPRGVRVRGDPDRPAGREGVPRHLRPASPAPPTRRKRRFRPGSLGRLGERLLRNRGRLRGTGQPGSHRAQRGGTRTGGRQGGPPSDTVAGDLPQRLHRRLRRPLLLEDRPVLQGPGPAPHREGHRTARRVRHRRPSVGRVRLGLQEPRRPRPPGTRRPRLAAVPDPSGGLRAPVARLRRPDPRSGVRRRAHLRSRKEAAALTRPERVSRTTVYTKPWLTLFEDEIIRGDRPGRYTVVERADSVALLVRSDRDRLLFVHTYRYPTGELSLELPMGGID